MPTSRRSRSAFFRVGSSDSLATLDSRWCSGWSAFGTMNRISSRPTSAMPEVNQNSPCRPNRWVSTGPSTMATAKDTPMLMPIIAIALVRCCSRVRSESSAITAAEIAPAPCSTRPAITPQMESALAARAAPAAKISRPTTITGRRPMRSEMVPKGICRIAWVRP
ncbi:hypothetical protein D9M73_168450 [compost metagenome]